MSRAATFRSRRIAAAPIVALLVLALSGPAALMASAAAASGAPASGASASGAAPSGASASALAEAAPDTIYLTSGRVIRSASVRIEGDRVYFTQFGGTVSIPLAEVERIVDDDETEPAARPATPTATPSSVTTSPATAPTDPPTEDSSGAAGADEDPTADQPAYWIERIQEVDGRIARVQAELDRLPSYDDADKRLLRFSGQARYFIAKRKSWEDMLRDLTQTRRQLCSGARQAGITPGSLRAADVRC